MKTLRKIFSISLLVCSFFLIIYVFYKSEIIYNGLKRNYYLDHYLFSIIFLIFSILTFFLKKNYKDYFIISFLAFFICIYIFESFLTFKKLNYINSNEVKNLNFIKKNYEEKTKIKYDIRTKLEVYNDLKKIENNISVTVRPNFHIYSKNQDLFPLSGLSHSKTVYCNENGYYSIFKSDRYGFNNPDTEWDKDEIEFLLVGDSFTLGACVNRPNDIGSVLRFLTKKSILNLGYSGNGPLIEYATLREYLNQNVKNIVWVFTANNDFINLRKELDSSLLKKYLINKNFTQKLKFKQDKIDDKIIKIINSNKEKSSGIDLGKKNKYLKFKIRNFIKLMEIRSLIRVYKESKTIKDEYNNKVSDELILEFERILKKAKDLAKANNSNLYFVYLPDHQHYLKNNNNSNYLRIIDSVKKLDIKLIDVHAEVFKKETNPLSLFPFELPLHYNELGYKKVGEAIYNIVK